MKPTVFASHTLHSHPLPPPLDAGRWTSEQGSSSPPSRGTTPAMTPRALCARILMQVCSRHVAEVQYCTVSVDSSVVVVVFVWKGSTASARAFRPGRTEFALYFFLLLPVRSSGVGGGREGGSEGGRDGWMDGRTDADMNDHESSMTLSGAHSSTQLFSAQPFFAQLYPALPCPALPCPSLFFSFLSCLFSTIFCMASPRKP